MRNSTRRPHHRVLKVLSLLLLVLFTGQVTGAAELIGGDDCAQECADTGTGMDAPPCSFCHCCLASNVFLPPDLLAIGSPTQVRHGALAPEPTPAAAPPGEISHVPKSRFA